MMVIITGTPGTGKSSVSSLVCERLNAKLISINGLLEDYDLDLGVDDVRGYNIVDTESMIPVVDDIKDEYDGDLIIFEGHLAQDYPNADLVVVLRCDPSVLEGRLESRGWPEKKVRENVSSEILGICTSESYDTYGGVVQEVETSYLSVEEVSDVVVNVIRGKEKFSVGCIDYLDDYFSYIM